jgi:hypothetical protein
MNRRGTPKGHRAGLLRPTDRRCSNRLLIGQYNALPVHLNRQSSALIFEKTLI